MKKVLIIEDDQIVGNVYRNKLTVDGYEVQVKQDGESGLEAMNTFKPDLIMLDLILPNMSGIEVIRAVRTNPTLGRVPVVVFSNTYLTNLVQDAWKAGATKCLSKSNCSPKEVLDIVHSTIGKAESVAVRRTFCGAKSKKSRYCQCDRRGISGRFAQNLYRQSSGYSGCLAPKPARLDAGAQ
jgi:CheY-like chemotaxis protein